MALQLDAKTNSYGGRTAILTTKMADPPHPSPKFALTLLISKPLPSRRQAAGTGPYRAISERLFFPAPTTAAWVPCRPRATDTWLQAEVATPVRWVGERMWVSRAERPSKDKERKQERKEKMHRTTENYEWASRATEEGDAGMPLDRASCGLQQWQ